MHKLCLKATVLFIITMLFIPSFSGCTNSSQDKVPESLEGKPLRPAILTFYYPNSFDVSSARSDAKMVHEEIEKKAAYLKIRLNFKAIPYGEFYDRTEIAIGSGEAIDAILFGKPDTTFDFTRMAREGKLADITKLLPQYAPDIFRMMSEYDLQCIEVDRKSVGLPAINPIAKTPIVGVREDLLEKYNISDIKTFDDFEVYLKTIKENEGNVIPGWIDLGTAAIFAKAYGYEILDEDQGLVYKVNDPKMKIFAWEQTPEFKDVVNCIANWHKNGYIPEDISNEDLNNPAKVSSILQNQNVSGFIESYTNRDGITMKNFIMYPDRKITRTDLSRIISAVAFSAYSPNIERTLMFLDWIQRDRDNYELFIYGMQGKHYTIKNGRVRLPEGVNYSNSRYYPWQGCNAFINAKWDRGSGMSTDIGLKLVKNDSGYATHEGFYPDYSGVKDEAVSRSNQTFDIDQQLYLGTFTRENIADAVEKLKTAGTDKIVNEVQRQLDEWRTKKEQ